MKGQIQIKGLRELQKRAKRLDQKLQKKVYSAAVRKAARKSVFQEIKNGIPVRTGTLRKAISLRANNKPSKFLYGVKAAPRGLYASDRTARRRGVGAVYKPDWVARYYRFVETGTKYHAANPFLLDGLKAGSNGFLSGITRELRLGLERSAR